MQIIYIRVKFISVIVLCVYGLLEEINFVFKAVVGFLSLVL